MIVKCPYCTKELRVPDASLKNGNPTLICTGCTGKFRAKTEPKVELQAKAEPKPKPAFGSTQKPEFVFGKSKKADQYYSDQIGWLVVHDEHTRQQTFALKVGNQTIGRKSESKPCEIMIETGDMYMSRNHFSVDVTQRSNGMYDYTIADCNATNHTYINLNQLRADDEMFLKDGDTIQAGETKIVFKSNAEAKSSHQATQLVAGKSYNKTVLVSR
jgi:hypothetical protein